MGPIKLNIIRRLINKFSDTFTRYTAWCCIPNYTQYAQDYMDDDGNDLYHSGRRLAVCAEHLKNDFNAVKNLMVRNEVMKRSWCI